MPSGLLHRAPAIRDLLASGGESFSFEFMPAKTEADERQLWRAIRQLGPLRPPFVSVTYGARRAPPGRTIPATRPTAPQPTPPPPRPFTAAHPPLAPPPPSTPSP